MRNSFSILLFVLTTIEACSQASWSGSFSLPDNSQINKTLTIPATAELISEFAIEFYIQMTYDSDLDVYLWVNGTRHELFTDVGGGNDNFGTSSSSPFIISS